MKYNFNDKEIIIPDDEIDNYVDKLGISIEEAIEMWLDDNDFVNNEEAEALTQKAKDSKITQTIHQASGAAKGTKKPREDKEKEDIILGLFNFIFNTWDENAEITNKTKVIEFDISENHYKLDLIRQRKKKE